MFVITSKLNHTDTYTLIIPTPSLIQAIFGQACPMTTSSHQGPLMF